MFGLGKDSSAGLFSRLKAGLRKTQEKLGLRLQEVFRGATRVDEELYSELELALIEADVGPRTTERLLARLTARVRGERIEDPARVRAILKEEALALLAQVPAPPSVMSGEAPRVVLVVGVNGVGKTTTIGKLAARHAAAGEKVVVGAADTFRAAAGEQLEIWCQRAGARLVRHQEGADPGAVAFDAVETAVARGASLVLIDTAGRLHTKSNLMSELEKVRRVVGKRLPGAPHETLLILDATTGQNAIAQAREFSARSGITGLIVTKLDGTARGGVVLAILSELHLPIRYVGTGEGLEDLAEFDPVAFVEALF